MRSSYVLLRGLIGFAFLLTPAILPGQTGGPATAPLEPGDVVRLAFSREPEMSGDYPVDETGSVSLPILGVRQVTGIPASEMRRQVLAEYGEHLQNQAIQVTVLRRVRVLGEVNEPGLYHIDPTMTLGDAIALAGGATEIGKMDDIRIVRDGRIVEKDLDLTTMASTSLQSGDQIVIPEQSWISRNPGVWIGAAVSLVTTLIWSQF